MPVIRGALCCFSLTLIVAGCGSSVGVEVSRDETGDARFGLGEFNGRCEATASTDNVTYERRKEGDITYCKVTSLWSGTLLDMSEVREGVQQELDARGAPVNADQVDVTFTSLDVADVTVSMVKDGAPIAFPNLTYYAARAGVDGVAGILTANWPSADAAVNDPDVAFVDDVGGAGAKDALLEHMNAQYAAGQDVVGDGQGELEFAYDEAVLEQLSGAELRIDFDLNATAVGAASWGGATGG